MTKFPTDKELKETRDALENAPASKTLPRDASPVDRLKFSLCEEFVAYLLDNKATQRVLAEKIGIDESLVSKIVHYNFEEFTIDCLVKYLSLLLPNADVEILVKKMKMVV